MPRVQVILQFPRTELLQEGWGKSRLASALQPADLAFSNDLDAVTYRPAALPNKLWREPNTGVIMLRPTPLAPDYWEESLYDLYRLSIDKWAYGEASGFTPLLAIPGNSSMVTRRASKTSDIIEILADAAMAAILARMDAEMQWVMRTKDTLYQNEGLSVWVHPMGIYTDRATDYMLIKFGGSRVLQLQMNGTAAVWANLGTNPSEPNWIKTEEFVFSSGGVSHTRPFQITILPWGRHFITFLFSQTSKSFGLSRAVKSASAQSSFLYNIRQKEGRTRYDDTYGAYVKTEAAPIEVAIRRSIYNYSFAWARVRYPVSEELKTVAERMPEPKPGSTPTVVLRGYAEQFNPSQTGATSLTTILRNESGDPFDNATDQTLMPEVTFASDPDRLYTPELWSVDMSVDEITFTPDWEQIDISDRWTMVRFQRTTEPDVCTAELKLQNSANYSRLLGGWGPLRINILDQADLAVPVFDGYMTHRQPTLSGPLVVNEDQVSARDMWLRLNEYFVTDYQFLDGLNLLDVIQALIRRCGFLQAEISVYDPGDYLASIEFGGFSDPNDQKGINTEASVGDVLRDLLKLYTPLPIRVRWVNGLWLIYLAPQYDPNTPPTIRFYLESSLSEYVQDADRYAAYEYKIKSYPEWTIEEPDFNALIVRGATTTGNEAEAIEAVIPAIKSDARSVLDPLSPDFMGRVKTKIMGPPEVTASSQAELDRQARAYWDQNRRKPAILEFAGEWQPEIDVDQFIWVIGIDPDGYRVSYGAYRIEMIDVSIERDFDSRGGSDSRWSYEGNYTCVYVGSATDVDTPMFTAEEYIPQ